MSRYHLFKWWLHRCFFLHFISINSRLESTDFFIIFNWQTNCTSFINRIPSVNRCLGSFALWSTSRVVFSQNGFLISMLMSPHLEHYAQWTLLNYERKYVHFPAWNRWITIFSFFPQWQSQFDFIFSHNLWKIYEWPKCKTKNSIKDYHFW